MMISFLLSCPQPQSSCGTGMGREPVFSPFLLCLLSVSAIEFVQEGGTGVSCQAGATFLAEEWTFCSFGAREAQRDTCEVPICGSTGRPSSLPCALGPLLLATRSASKSAAQADTHLAEETCMSLSAIPTSPGCPSLLGDSAPQKTWLH